VTLRRTYAITAATGRTGRIVSQELLARGHRVRAIGRDAARLAPLVAQGAEPFVGDVRDAVFVERTFRGADAAYLVNPADHHTRDFRRAFREQGAIYARAARATQLGSAVFLSTVGTHDDRHRGFIMTHGDVELVLDEVEGLDVLHLRAPNFFENLFYFLPASQASGSLASPLDPDAPLDMAGSRDIAMLAAEKLHALDFAGKTSLELHGRSVLTTRHIAERIGSIIGQPFSAVRVDREVDIEAMVAHGMHRDFSNLINDTWGTFSRYGLLRAPAPQASVKATTPIDVFLREQFVPALWPSSDPLPAAPEAPSPARAEP
jgi:uncharacterized protein YbjT (DUF2867 family)